MNLVKGAMNIAFFFIKYFLYIHFKCYPFSWFPLQKLPIPPLSPPPLTNPPTPTSLPWHSPTLGHRAFSGPRASLPIDVQQVHPLLHMQLEPWIPPCFTLIGDLVPGSSGSTSWFILLFLYGAANTFNPFSPFSSSSIQGWGPCAQSNGWLRASIFLFVRHWQTLSGDTCITVSCQQALVCIHNRFWVW